jgi:hypothetical protein
MAYSKLQKDGSIDLLVYKYRDFSIYNCFGLVVKVGKDINPQAQVAPKVVHDAFYAYYLTSCLITFDELVEVCQEERDSRKKVPQSYLQ